MICQISIVRRFDDLTHSDRFWLEIDQNDSRDVFFVRRFEDLTNFEPKSVRICQIIETANSLNLSNHQNEACDQFFVIRNS